MGSVNDNIQSALSPIYGAKSTNHLLRLFREDHGLLENDRWQAYLQGTPLSDLTGITTSPVGSLADIERLLFENFSELHNPATGLYLPGTTGNYASTPDHADLDITTDLSVIMRLKNSDWYASAESVLISKYGGVGNRGWRLFASTIGIAFNWSSDGTTLNPSVTLLIATYDMPTDVDLWFAITHDVDNGSSENVLTWWIGGYSSVPAWEIVDSTISSGTTSHFNNSQGLEIGIRTGAAGPLLGTIYSAQIYDGIGDNSAPGLGTLVAEFDASAPVGPRYRDRTGKIWTINGSAWSWE